MPDREKTPIMRYHVENAIRRWRLEEEVHHILTDSKSAEKLLIWFQNIEKSYKPMQKTNTLKTTLLQTR